MVVESGGGGVNLRKRVDKTRPESEDDNSSENEVDEDGDDVEKAEDSSSVCSTSVSETVSR